MSTPRKRPCQRTPEAIRCAIYTRKNIDAGRNGEFNSIRRQRQAIRAFIASRKSQGWVALPKIYEDVGQSAGTMKRPALRRLLADMNAGKVDCVVVHTFDRLARSFADRETLFAAFERRGVTLVIVCPAISDVIREDRMLNALVVTKRRSAEQFRPAVFLDRGAK